MPHYTIDLNARYVPKTRRTWRMFPGKDYKFINAFLAEGMVFLDLPGLVLPSGFKATEFSDLKDRLLVARAAHKWIEDYRKWNRGPHTSSAPERPSSTKIDYTSQPRHKSYTNDVGSVSALFGEAEKGDLVVVPNRLASRQVHIGEFTGDPEERLTFQDPERFFHYSVPYRAVRWFLPANELELPLELSDVLRRPVPISLLSNLFYDHIFEKSYGTYFTDREYAARITISGSDFDSQNTLDLGLLSKLAAFVAAAAKFEENFTDQEKYAEILLSPEFQCNFSLNINSPGFGTLRSACLVL